MICNRVERTVKIQAVVVAGIYEHASVQIDLCLDIDLAAVRRRDNLLDWQVVFPGELPVASVMARHGHYRTCAIAHQYEIGDPQRHFLARQRMDRRDTQWHPFLFHCLKRRFLSIRLFALCNERCNFRIHCCRLARQRMLGRDGHVSHTHQCVWARRIHRKRLVLVNNIERELNTFRTTDPVTLHCLDRVGPARHSIQFIEQLVRIICDFHEPLRNFTTLYERIGAPPSPIDNLFISEHGLVNGVPVNDRILPVNEALFEHLRKKPLFPAVVLRAARRNFT